MSLIVVITYALVSLLVGSGPLPDNTLVEETCAPRYVGMSSEAELRQRLVDAFAPTLVFASGEPADLETEVVVPYQIVPDFQDPSRFVWRGALTVASDYGATSFTVRADIAGRERSLGVSRALRGLMDRVFGQTEVDPHAGDVEMVELFLKPSAHAGYWEIDVLRTNPHGKPRTYSAHQLRCFHGSPILFVSRGKHALYSSLKECNQASVLARKGVQLTAETCSTGTLYRPSTAPEFNVGDRNNPNNIFATSPRLIERGIFQGEDAWGACFYGGANKAPSLCRSRFRWW